MRFPWANFSKKNLVPERLSGRLTSGTGLRAGALALLAVVSFSFLTLGILKRGMQPIGPTVAVQTSSGIDPGVMAKP